MDDKEALAKALALKPEYQNLPDLPNESLSLADLLIQNVNQSVGKLLGDKFSFNSGLQYRNGGLTANFGRDRLKATYPIAGGTISGIISGIGDSPYYELKYNKSFK